MIKINDLPHADRIRPLNANASGGHFNATGEFVLLWLHHAVRAHENAALDVAIALANQLRQPLLVYQGLAGKHRFNSDRQHRFILEGAADVALQFAELGISYVMHVPSDPAAKSPLPGLIARASAFACEEFPAPPFPRWTNALTQSSSTPAWAVDASCILPMHWHGRAIERAFSFRDASNAQWQQRLQADWPADAPKVAYRQGLLPESALANAGLSLMTDACELPNIISRCKIDHSIAAIPGTAGGTAAGYARWEKFKAGALNRYAQTRNDAANPQGVSRLSAYLHHGHISAFRIAKQAQAQGGAGAEKFLDELLVWRELAQHWCFYRQHTLERLSALPGWAQTSLQENAHLRDAKEYPLETLEQARTHDPLWNAAQLSLLRHGELHNNIRMTWGKALALWSANPKAAQRNLIDLNHRYALDGNNPNSYGGLLWCLGLFDRPFQGQQKSALGSIRARPTAVHAGRLDFQSYQAQQLKPVRKKLRVAIIGAGLTGLSCARALADAGHELVLFDKARGVGGRMSTRRSELGDFDHGAQYFTARDPRFVRAVKLWRADGVVQRWRGRLAAFSAGVKQTEPVTPQPRFVAVPGMSALAKHLAAGLSDQAAIKLGGAVTEIKREGAHWRVLLAEQSFAGFDVVLLATPAPQAHALLQAIDGAADLLDTCAKALMQPCWASMLALADPLAVDFDGAFVNHTRADAPEHSQADAKAATSVLSWIARDSAKPSRRVPQPARETWVLHASPSWSALNLEADAEQVGAAMLAEFTQLTGQKPIVLHQSTHRWRYALGGLTQAADAGTNEQNSAFYDPRLVLGIGGDWCMGGRVEAAFLSGMALAGKVLRA
jgi:photolyase PhrII